MPVAREMSPEYSTKEVTKRASLLSKAFAGATILLSALATDGTPVGTAHAELRPESRRLSMTTSWKRHQSPRLVLKLAVQATPTGLRVRPKTLA